MYSFLYLSIHSVFYFLREFAPNPVLLCFCSLAAAAAASSYYAAIFLFRSESIQIVCNDIVEDFW